MKQAKMLVVYFSRTGVTKCVAESIRDELDCDISEIKSSLYPAGFTGYLKATWDVMTEHEPVLEHALPDPRDYDLVIVGSPVWKGSLCSPVRSFIKEKGRWAHRLAFFVTHNGYGAEAALRSMERLSHRIPLHTLEMTRQEIFDWHASSKIREFTSKIVENENYWGPRRPQVSASLQEPRPMSLAFSSDF